MSPLIYNIKKYYGSLLNVRKKQANNNKYRIGGSNSMEDIPMNPECAKCPLSGKHNPCPRIFQRWKWTHDVARPEFVASIVNIIHNHPEQNV